MVTQGRRYEEKLQVFFMIIYPEGCRFFFFLNTSIDLIIDATTVFFQWYEMGLEEQMMFLKNELLYLVLYLLSKRFYFLN